MSHSENQKNLQEPVNKISPLIRVRWVAIRLTMILFDIVAVNLSFFLALVIRFYAANEINEYARWCFPAFRSFAPYYTICCIVVFLCFRLYSGMWKYAGINDMNRIIGANLITFVIQVGGTLLFVDRMPITYYLLGALIQFMLIAGSRFSYRLISAEKTVALKGRRAELNVMIVGVGETARIVRKKLDTDHSNAAHPVCMFACTGNNIGKLMDGLPVLSGMDKLKNHIRKYGVECVILADSILADRTRQEIKAICKEADVGVQDFSGYFQNDGSDLPMVKLMQYTSGPVELVIDGKAQTYTDGEQALMAVDGKYDVQSIFAREGTLVVELSKHLLVLNNLNEEWVREQEQETGETISFF